MGSKNEILYTLTEFKNKPKFNHEQWTERGLNPSSDELIFILESSLNELIENISTLVGNERGNSDFTKEISKWLKKIKTHNLDTEEREFILFYLFELSEIINCDLKKIVLNWMYGPHIAELMGKQEESHYDEKIEQECTKCGIALESFVKKENGVSFL